MVKESAKESNRLSAATSTERQRQRIEIGFSVKYKNETILYSYLFSRIKSLDFAHNLFLYFIHPNLKTLFNFSIASSRMCIIYIFKKLESEIFNKPQTNARETLIKAFPTPDLRRKVA